MKAKLVMNPITKLLNDKGLDNRGDVQRFHTQNVLRRIVKYMPYRTGATVKLTITQTDIRKPYIITDAPYAKYLYYGKVMEGKTPKTVTGRPLNYTKTQNPQAGPFWDRALAVSEMPALVADLQRYINRRS